MPWEIKCTTEILKRVNRLCWGYRAIGKGEMLSCSKATRRTWRLGWGWGCATWGLAWRTCSYACMIHLHSHFQNRAAEFSEFVEAFEI